MNPAEYVLDLCARIAAHTDVPGTITRTFLSPATTAVHTLLRAEMEALGMHVRTDSAGNLRGIYPANIGGAPLLLIGSHIDTVPDAGAFDGTLGVAMPLALLRSLGGRRLPYAIEIIAFSEEEGVRFKLPLIGSRALVGTLGPNELARTDADGISVAQALRDFGLDPGNLEDAKLSKGTFAFLEVHIEQGPILESLNVPLGIVDTIVGQSRYELTFTGQANHAGTTPMHLRRDALAAAAAWLPFVESHACKEHAVATVGSMQVFPGATNIVPGLVRLSLDVRDSSDAVRIETAEGLIELAQSMASIRGIAVASELTSIQAATPMDLRLRTALAEAASAEGLKAHPMASGAGHDAMILAPHLPTAMLFLRTPRGLSHHPEEAVSLEDIQAALSTCHRFLDALDPSSFAS